MLGCEQILSSIFGVIKADAGCIGLHKNAFGTIIDSTTQSFQSPYCASDSASADYRAHQGWCQELLSRGQTIMRSGWSREPRRHCKVAGSARLPLGVGSGLDHRTPRRPPSLLGAFINNNHLLTYLLTYLKFHTGTEHYSGIWQVIG